MTDEPRWYVLQEVWTGHRLTLQAAPYTENGYRSRFAAYRVARSTPHLFGVRRGDRVATTTERYEHDNN